MKKLSFIFLSVIAGLSIASCNKHNEVDTLAGRSAKVSITLEGAKLGETKALPVEANEVLVNTVDAFVFNSTLDLDAYGHYTSSDFTTDGTGKTTLNEGKELSCTAGAGKIVYVVINGTDANRAASEIEYAKIATEAQLKARIFKLEDNLKAGTPATLDNFQMIGKTADQSFKAGENTVDVQVIRAVARVVIKKITKSFSNAGLAAGTLAVKNIYMSNVVGRYGYGNIIDNDYKFDDSSIAKAYAADYWYNKYKVDGTTKSIDIQSAYNMWLNRGLAANVEFGDNTSASVSKTDEIASTFYVMPNDVAWGTTAFGPVGGDSWSARHTKLVIETEYAGKTYYYAIPIAENVIANKFVPLGDASDTGAGYNGIKANYSYEIDELELTRLGSTNPDEPTVLSTVNFNITVKPWTVMKLSTSGDKYVI